ncbi:MAG: hypothetical protein QNJ37_12685 [Crocosphaera sp.]|nr:hypothetical protein [Crocosphaera sp.]
MNKPNFKEMTRKELKKYVLSHPTDDEAIRELFINRRNPNAKIYPYPYEMSYEEVEAIFKSKINKDKN